MITQRKVSLLARSLLALLLVTALAACEGPRTQLSPGQRQNEADLWVQSLAESSPAAQAQAARDMWYDASKPQYLRDRAAFLFSARPGAQTGEAQQALASVYQKADANNRQAMEKLLYKDLQGLDNISLKQLAGMVKTQQQTIFPWSVIMGQAAMKKQLADNAAMLKKLEAPGVLAVPGLFGGTGQAVVQGTVSTSLGTAAPAAGPRYVALLLPLQGNFGNVGQQVLRGANAARSVLESQGVRVEIAAIDTESPDWLSRLNALPSQYVMVGGPLRADAFAVLRDAQLAGQRAVFAFMPQLPNPGDEGQGVWRFFTSPEDQIQAVQDFAIRELGIVSFGVFYPEENYGRRMADLFSQAGARRNVNVRMGSYPVDDMKSWLKLAGDFVDAAGAGQGNKAAPTARAGFDAIFLPDSWKNMDMLISSLRYHGAHNRVMLGTALWEQSLAAKPKLDPATFSLTLFPGEWDENSPQPAAFNLITGMGAQGAKADAWSALGFDFVSLAVTLNLAAMPAPMEMNRLLAAGPGMSWSGAPIVWNPQGVASRRLFLFQPSANGMQALNVDAFLAHYRGKGGVPNKAVMTPVQGEDQQSLEELLNTIVPAPAPEVQTMPVAPASPQASSAAQTLPPPAASTTNPASR